MFQKQSQWYPGQQRNRARWPKSFTESELCWFKESMPHFDLLPWRYRCLPSPSLCLAPATAKGRRELVQIQSKFGNAVPKERKFFFFFSVPMWELERKKNWYNLFVHTLHLDTMVPKSKKKLKYSASIQHWYASTWNTFTYCLIQ